MEIQIEVSRIQTGWWTVDITERIADAVADTVELVRNTIKGTFEIDAEDIMADVDEYDIDWDTTDGLTLESVALS